MTKTLKNTKFLVNENLAGFYGSTINAGETLHVSNAAETGTYQTCCCKAVTIALIGKTS